MRRVHRRHRPAAFGSGRASCSVTCGSRSSSRDPVPAGAAPRRSPRSVSRPGNGSRTWVIPVFILDTAASKLADADTTRARDEASSRAPASATRSCATPPKTTASAAPPSAPDTPKPRLATSASATTSEPRSHDPTDDQLHALHEIVCRLLCQRAPASSPTAPAGPTPARQQPVGDTGCHEPRREGAPGLPRASRDTYEGRLTVTQAPVGDDRAKRTQLGATPAVSCLAQKIEAMLRARNKGRHQTVRAAPRLTRSTMRPRGVHFSRRHRRVRQG